MSPKNQNMHVGFRKVWKKLGAGFNMKRKENRNYVYYLVHKVS